MTGFRPLPHKQNSSDEIRKVGVEFEFAGLPFQEAGAIIQELFGGQLDVSEPYAGEVKNTSLGDFQIEVDSRFLQEEEFRHFLEKVGIDVDLKRKELLDKGLIHLFSNIVPHEIATPPIPFDKLSELGALERELVKRGGEGTQVSPFYAFGLHLNIEIVEPSVEHILSILKAFIVLSPWLRQESRRDFSRRISRYTEPYSKEFEIQILTFDSTISLEELQTTYLQLANTRNHELDLFPLLAHLGVKNFPSDEIDRISPRPAYHYRLPDCRIGEKEWSLKNEWNRWVLIEELAEDQESLEHLSKECLHEREKPILTTLMGGGAELEAWLQKRTENRKSEE